MLDSVFVSLHGCRKLDKINFRGKLFIGGLIAMVNVVFWSVAVAQYLRSYERLL